MANTSAVYARIDTNLKDNAESILSQLGISPSSAIQMLYSSRRVLIPSKQERYILQMKSTRYLQRSLAYDG